MHSLVLSPYYAPHYAKNQDCTTPFGGMESQIKFPNDIEPDQTFEFLYLYVSYCGIRIHIRMYVSYNSWYFDQQQRRGFFFFQN